MTENILQAALELMPVTVSHRRRLHEHPECMPHEQTDTMAYIEQELDSLQIPHVRVANGGIFGFIECARPGKTLLLRADMDALPIEESPENLAGPRNCISQVPGVMHACGHDAHTAMLLTEARMLKDMAPSLPGRIVLMFEEGEEGGGNIQQLCRYIGDSRMQIDGAYACHVRSTIPSGIIEIPPAASMCGLYHFRVEIRGQTGHGSRPDEGSNVIDCFTQIHTALQNVRMTCVAPYDCLTYSMCTLKAGTRHNILPDYLQAEGTIRFDRTAACERFVGRFRDICRACGEMTGCRAELICVENHYPVISDNICRQRFRQAAAVALGTDSVRDGQLWMASETFSYIANMFPSVFVFLGIRNEAYGSGAGHHTSRFDVDEAALPYGAAAAVAYTASFLQDPPDTSGFIPMRGSMDEYLSLLANCPF